MGEGRPFLAGPPVPEPNLAVPARGEQRLAVRAKAQAQGMGRVLQRRFNFMAVTVQEVRYSGSSLIHPAPELDDTRLAIRTESCGTNGAVVLKSWNPRFARGHIPQLCTSALRLQPSDQDGSTLRTEGGEVHLT